MEAQLPKCSEVLWRKEYAVSNENRLEPCILNNRITVDSVQFLSTSAGTGVLYSFTTVSHFAQEFAFCWDRPQNNNPTFVATKTQKQWSIPPFSMQSLRYAVFVL